MSIVSEDEGYVRLRQICLATDDLDEAEGHLRALLDLEVSHRDERVERHGLVNFVTPIGSSFLEVVAPTQEWTRVGRFLERGSGAYMAIFDCAELQRWAGRVEAAGVRIAQRREYPNYAHIQLHPKDMGATLVEINHSAGGDSLDGRYDPGGEDWQDFVRRRKVDSLLGIEIATADVAGRAAIWGRVLGRQARPESGSATRIDLDYGFVRFRPTVENEIEQLSTLYATAHAPEEIIAMAGDRGLPVREGAFRLGGVWFALHPVL